VIELQSSGAVAGEGFETGSEDGQWEVDFFIFLMGDGDGDGDER
jgi:hypothetical protein